jgi:hypothetical protein
MAGSRGGDAGTGSDLEVFLAVWIRALPSEVSVFVGTDRHTDLIPETPQAAETRTAHNVLIIPPLNLITSTIHNCRKSSGRLFFHVENTG